MHATGDRRSRDAAATTASAVAPTVTTSATVEARDNDDEGGRVADPRQALHHD